MAIFSIDGWSTNEIETIMLFQSGKCVALLDEINAFKITNAEEEKSMTLGDGAVFGTKKHSKKVTGSGTSAVLSGGLMAVQLGTEEKHTDIKVKQRDSGLTISGTETLTCVTRCTASGTVGSEIGYVWVTNASTGVKTQYEQTSSTLATGKFTYTAATKTITFYSDDVTAGDKVECYYDVALDDNTATQYTSNIDNFAEEAEVVVTCLAKNACGEEALMQLIIPRCDFKGNFEEDFGGDQLVHNFEFEALANKCGGEHNLWNHIIYNDPAAV